MIAGITRENESGDYWLTQYKNIFAVLRGTNLLFCRVIAWVAWILACS
jgi:hypothetical protein